MLDRLGESSALMGPGIEACKGQSSARTFAKEGNGMR